MKDKSTYMEEWLQNPHTEEQPVLFVVNAENSPKTVFTDPHIPNSIINQVNNNTITAINEIMEETLESFLGDNKGEEEEEEEEE